jgi:hypothetical protein
MGIFQPVDVRGPDRRRKMLLNHIMQRGHGPAIFKPGPIGAVGRSFRGSSALPHGHFTQGGNILSSILNQLGVGGQDQGGLGNEHSPGAGIPVPLTHPNSGFGPDRGAAFGGPPIPTPPPLDVPPPSLGPINGPSLGNGPSMPGNIPPDSGGVGSNILPTYGGDNAINTITSGPAPNLVPLGNGLYYDPTLNQVVGGMHGGPTGIQQ